jgi:subtilisin inhibitor-like
LAAVVLASALAAGCLGGSTSTGGGRGAARQTPTHVVITYFAAYGRRCPGPGVAGCTTLRFQSEPHPTDARIVLPTPGARLVRCPHERRTELRCFAVTRQPGDAPIVVQQRELSCSPQPRGGYADPAAACRALVDYARLVNRSRRVCSCAVSLWPASMVGVVDGRRVTFGLDGCCLPRRAGADQRVLTPDLGG